MAAQSQQEPRQGRMAIHNGPLGLEAGIPLEERDHRCDRPHIAVGKVIGTDPAAMASSTKAGSSLSENMTIGFGALADSARIPSSASRSGSTISITTGQTPDGFDQVDARCRTRNLGQSRRQRLFKRPRARELRIEKQDLERHRRSVASTTWTVNQQPNWRTSSRAFRRRRAESGRHANGRRAAGRSAIFLLSSRRAATARGAPSG